MACRGLCDSWPKRQVGYARYNQFFCGVCGKYIPVKEVKRDAAGGYICLCCHTRVRKKPSHAHHDEYTRYVAQLKQLKKRARG